MPAPSRGSGLGALGTICVAHLLVLAVFVGWVLSWPDTVDGGGPYHFTFSKWVMALLLGTLFVLPALGVSFAISWGALAALRRLRRRSGAAAGTVASLIGLAAVSGATAIYALTR